MELKLEPTTDGEPETATTDEPLLQGAAELRIAMEPELLVMLDQVRELATTAVTREKAIVSEIAEKSSAHAPWLRVSYLWIWVNGKQRETL